MADNSQKTFSLSADYQYIELALKSRWPAYEELAYEFKSFTPKGLNEFQEGRIAEFERLKGLNPASTDEDMMRFVDEQISARANPDFQIFMKFANSVMSEYVTVAFLAHALCEAYINMSLAIGLGSNGTVELFDLLERAEVKEKWLIGPKALYPGYVFPKGGALYETLRYLTKQRNELIHYKTSLEIDGKPIHPGTKLDRPSLDIQIEWIHRFFSLPYDLSDFLAKTMPEPWLFSSHYRSPITQAPAHAKA